MTCHPAGVNNQVADKPSPVNPEPGQSPHIVVPVPEATASETPVRPPSSAQRDEWDILKAIVYGGLVESITSLSVVSAAAASGAKTRKFLSWLLYCIAELLYYGTQVRLLLT